MKNPAALRPLAALWDWQASAACRGQDSLVFFSPTGERGPARARRERRAKQICAGCAVRDECAAFAAALGERHGTWGGLTDKERGHVRTGLPED
jgi:WhiB family redox-sensing transcriptional regulator